ncbi:hypothetical protein [Burkholderia guangdongensis]|uniref:hypothetical protein n=1 Tax=Burkholderia guangdongensis TaxID=1792500 RepID=UPI0015C90DA6|nr:hypothetical protein [Burkholderia guangdongensis]
MNAISLARLRGAAPRARAALAVGVLCALVAGCGGDSSDDASGAVKANVNAAAAGAGGASAPVPIVAMPGAGPCPASGTTALPSPSLNAQLRCAP